jgi:hypothetical protein
MQLTLLLPVFLLLLVSLILLVSMLDGIFADAVGFRVFAVVTVVSSVTGGSAVNA